MLADLCHFQSVPHQPDADNYHQQPCSHFFPPSPLEPFSSHFRTYCPGGGSVLKNVMSQQAVGGANQPKNCSTTGFQLNRWSSSVQEPNKTKTHIFQLWFWCCCCCRCPPLPECCQLVFPSASRSLQVRRKLLFFHPIVGFFSGGEGSGRWELIAAQLQRALVVMACTSRTVSGSVFFFLRYVLAEIPISIEHTGCSDGTWFANVFSYTFP